MELADNGNLEEKINQAKKKGQRFSEPYIWSVLLQIGTALREMHSLGIAHRDIKPANIFLFKDGSAKLADMNVSKVIKRDPLRTQTGTPMYASPEVWDELPYDLKSDVWSLGCVIYEMAMLRPPYDAGSMDEVYARVKQNLPDHIPVGYTEKLQSVIHKMLKGNPMERISISRLLPYSGKLLSLASTKKIASEVAGREGHHLLAPSDSHLMKTLRLPRKEDQINALIKKSLDSSIGNGGSQLYSESSLPVSYSLSKAHSSASLKSVGRRSAASQAQRQRDILGMLNMGNDKRFLERQIRLKLSGDKLPNNFLRNRDYSSNTRILQ